VSLVSRHLEANGLPTVIVGSARDVVEHCGVPRFLFNDFPLGNPIGHPWRADMQREVVRLALSLLETAPGARTTVVSPFKWKDDDPDWRERYGRVSEAERDKLIAAGEARRKQRAAMKQGKA
jgi:D-proline reductase (dithiol) PrdB